MFGVSIELEAYSPPGGTKSYFLGSEWNNGVPSRNINRMLARILFGSGDMPRLTDLELFQSRCYEILGNVGSFSEIYNTFKVPYPNRVFRFYELADYEQQKRIKKAISGHEKRGVFENITLCRHTANNVWKSR